MEVINLAETEYPEDFRYIVRLMNTDLNGEKPTLYALTDIKGVGTRVAESLVKSSGVSPNKKIGLLDDEEIESLKKSISEFSQRVPYWFVNRKRDPYTGEDRHYFGADIETALRDDINRLRKISCYRGVRHDTGQKVRGQRTRSNGRTGLTVGVHRRKMSK